MYIHNWFSFICNPLVNWLIMSHKNTLKQLFQCNQKMVFCYKNCSDLLWEKNVLVIEKFFLDHYNNLFKQWKVVRTIFGKVWIFLEGQTIWKKYLDWETYKKVKNGILLPKLFWPTVRKKCSSDWEKNLKLEAEGWRLKAQNVQKIWDHKNNLFKQWKFRTIFDNRMLFNLFLEVSQI